MSPSPLDPTTIPAPDVAARVAVRGVRETVEELTTIARSTETGAEMFGRLARLDAFARSLVDVEAEEGFAGGARAALSRRARQALGELGPEERPA